MPAGVLAQGLLRLELATPGVLPLTRVGGHIQALDEFIFDVVET